MVRYGVVLGLLIAGSFFLWVMRQARDTAPAVVTLDQETTTGHIPSAAAIRVLSTIENTAPWILAPNAKSSTTSSAPSSHSSQPD